MQMKERIKKILMKLLMCHLSEGNADGEIIKGGFHIFWIILLYNLNF